MDWLPCKQTHRVVAQDRTAGAEGSKQNKLVLSPTRRKARVHAGACSQHLRTSNDVISPIPSFVSDHSRAFVRRKAATSQTTREDQKQKE